MPIRGPLQARILFCKPTSENSEACVGHVFCRAHGLLWLLSYSRAAVVIVSTQLVVSSSGGGVFQIEISALRAGTHPAISTPPESNLNFFLPCLFPFSSLVPSWSSSRFSFQSLHSFASRGFPPPSAPEQHRIPPPDLRAHYFRVQR